jgi:hypothetical protein
MPTCSPAPPLDHVTAERIAAMAVRPGGCRTLVGPRVLAALLRRIFDLEAERMILRRELDQLRAHAMEQARLRAHAMFVRRQGGVQR